MERTYLSLNLSVLLKLNWFSGISTVRFSLYFLHLFSLIYYFPHFPDIPPVGSLAAGFFRNSAVWGKITVCRAIRLQHTIVRAQRECLQVLCFIMCPTQCPKAQNTQNRSGKETWVTVGCHSHLPLQSGESHA